MASYPSSTTDSEWEILERLMPPSPDTLQGRPTEHPRRDIVDGILYIIRTGGASRMIPNDLPYWKICYYYFRLLAKLGHWERIHNRSGTGFASRTEKKPRRLRSSIVKAFGQLDSPEFVALMRVRKLQEENDTFW